MITPGEFKLAVEPRSHAADVDSDERRALAAYYGGPEIMPFINEHSRKEDAEKLAWRREKTVSHYVAYPAEIASTYIEGVYRSKEVRRTCDDPDLDLYFANEYDAWMQQECGPLALNMPEPWIFFRVPNPEYLPLSRRDENDQRLWPRPCLELASTVLNFALDEDGQLRWVSRKMKQRLDGGNEREYFEVVDEANVYHLNAEGVLISQTNAKGEPAPYLEHGFFDVPVIYAPWRRHYGKGKRGVAFLASVIQLTFGCLDVIAMLEEAVQFHLKPQLLMTPEAVKEAQKHGMGPGQPLVVDSPETSSLDPVRYLTKPSMEFDILMRRAYEIYPKLIYRAARLRDRMTDAAVSSSGISKLLDAVPELAALSAVANYFQAIDQRACEIIARYKMGKRDVKVEVKYPTSFDLRSPQERLAEIAGIAKAAHDTPEIELPPLGVAELMKQFFHSVLVDADPTLLTAIEAQIDDWAKGQSEVEKVEVAPVQAAEAQPEPMMEMEMEGPMMGAEHVMEAEGPMAAEPPEMKNGITIAEKGQHERGRADGKRAQRGH